MTEPPMGTEHVDAYHDDHESPGEVLEQPLSRVPRRPTLLVSPDAKLSEVIAQMNERTVGCALVVQDDLLVGIFTERDVLTKVASGKLDGDRVPIRQLMTASPASLPKDATVAFALNRMSIDGFRHIPIVDDDGKPVGVVAMRDIINWIVELYPNRVHNVPPVPSSYPTRPEGG